MPPTDIRHRFSGATRIANGHRHAPTPDEAYLTGLVTVMKLLCAAPYRQPAFEHQHERAVRSIPNSISMAFKVRFLLQKQHLKTNRDSSERTIIDRVSQSPRPVWAPRHQCTTQTTTAPSLSERRTRISSKAVGAYLDSQPRPPGEDRGAT